jgi:hypothetical protein
MSVAISAKTISRIERVKLDLPPLAEGEFFPIIRLGKSAPTPQG